MKIKCTFTLSRETLKPYDSKLVTFELKITKETPKILQMFPGSK